MTVKRHNAKRDANEPEIYEALRWAGCSVERLSQRGVPDLLVWTPEKGLMLLEVKTTRGKLTPDQIEWHEQWEGPVYVVESIEEALEVVGR